MKHNAAWFFNFFHRLSNWTVGRRYLHGDYCAIGHLQSYEGIADRALEDMSPNAHIYNTPLVTECAEVIFNGSLEGIWRTNDDKYDRHWPTPKDRILGACRKAILRDNPECQLGKEYDT